MAPYIPFPGRVGMSPADAIECCVSEPLVKMPQRSLLDRLKDPLQRSPHPTMPSSSMPASRSSKPFAAVKAERLKPLYSYTERSKSTKWWRSTPFMNANKLSSPSSTSSTKSIETGNVFRPQMSNPLNKVKRAFHRILTSPLRSFSGDLQRTLVLKENYTCDLSLAKQRVVCSPGGPSIPDSVWVDVLANHYVDLDKIFSAIYAVDGDRKSCIKLGELELVEFPAKPKRLVQRHGHWTVAWALYQRAVLYVYPHREGELRAYSDQINSFFAAIRLFCIVVQPAPLRSPTTHGIVYEACIRFTRLSAPLGSTDTAMSALPVPLETMSLQPAPKRPREDPTPIVANERPRHFRDFLWGHDEPPSTPLATLSESMGALPPHPTSELLDDAAWSTIHAFPHLFAITTPVRVDVLETLLKDHPNQPLVASVCRGFREGFWPFADAARLATFPETWDEANVPLNDMAAQFAMQYAEEERAGRYSAPFSGELLPGMYSMPVHADLKPYTEKLRCIKNHSAGRFSLNSMIDRHSVGL
ncbi:hypothetical protein VTO73DRAFT_13930 [Trametes versicolor]